MENDTKKAYVEAVGRRKTSIARVRVSPATKASFTVNGKNVEDYFKSKEGNRVATEAFSKAKVEDKFKVEVMVQGGGFSSQAEAIRHGLARVLVEKDQELRRKLKKAGFLKRDPRSKERRKFGLKKARKAPQWSKR
jgi:small subunit ribosomal protein S9